MKRKTLISVMLASTMAGVSTAQAEQAHALGAGQFNGFLDSTYMLSDGTNDPADSPTAQKWDVNAEFDYKQDLAKDVKLRMDMDLNLAGNGGASTSDSAKMEQGFISYQPSNALRITGGAFNNPLGWEAEDAPDMMQISHGQIYDLLDAETALWGNNVSGVAVSGVVGPMVITGGLLTDLGNVDEKSSFALVVNGNLTKGLEIEGGLLTDSKRKNLPNSQPKVSAMERIIDVNVSYKDPLFTVGGELLLASATVDNALGVTASYSFTDQLSGTFRFDTVSYEAQGLDATNTITLAVGYLLEKNLGVNFEIKLQDDPNDPDTALSNGIIGDGDKIGLEFLAQF